MMCPFRLLYLRWWAVPMMLVSVQKVCCTFNAHMQRENTQLDVNWFTGSDMPLFLPFLLILLLLFTACGVATALLCLRIWCVLHSAPFACLCLCLHLQLLEAINAKLRSIQAGIELDTTPPVSGTLGPLSLPTLSLLPSLFDRFPLYGPGLHDKLFGWSTSTL